MLSGMSSTGPADAVARAEEILFSRPYRASRQVQNLLAVEASDHMHGDGPFGASATRRLRELTGTSVLLTSSGTHALEMTSLLLDLGPGDEVVLPSFTFPSAGLAVARTGASCVFADCDPLTGNIDPESVAAAMGPRTRAISVMHYGGVPVDLDAVGAIARRWGVPVIEDNAHGLGVRLGDRVLGTVGALGIQSFHDTKNVQCGEGGALLVNDPELLARAEIIREKGTDRSRFLRGEVDKYSWVDTGSSYPPSELQAAVLDAQLEEFATIQERRHAVWSFYARALADWAREHEAVLMRPEPVHAAHLFFLLMPDGRQRDALLRHARARGVHATSHYEPLHSSAAGRRFGRPAGELAGTLSFSSRLVRLPLWPDLSARQRERVVDAVLSFQPALQREGAGA